MCIRDSLEGANAGTIRTRSGDPYKPSAIRSYDATMEARVLPDFGAAKVSAITFATFKTSPTSCSRTATIGARSATASWA